jgi:hypothetical protein
MVYYPLFAPAIALAPDVVLCAVGPPFSQAEAKRIAELGLTFPSLVREIVQKNLRLTLSHQGFVGSSS